MAKRNESEILIDQLKNTNNFLKEKIDALEGQLLTLNELLGASRKETKQIDVLKNKLSSYKKVIQFLVGIENGDVLTSEVK